MVPQGNAMESQSANDFTANPEKFSVIEFGNSEVGDNSEPLDFITEIPATPLNNQQLHNLRESPFVVEVAEEDPRSS